MGYIDVCTPPIKRDRRESHKRSLEVFVGIWKNHGAVSLTEALSDGLAWGEVSSFPRAVKLEDDEVCVVSVVRFPDKSSRERAMGAVMSDPRAKASDMHVIDGKRVIFAAFVPFVDELAFQLALAFGKKGSGATGIPSSSSFFASSRRASP